MTGATHKAVAAAMQRHRQLSKQGLLERAFAWAFRGLVYAQIWEDPVVDMAALAITPDCHVVTIASGGCNALSYLTADPGAITAVDLNTAHIALGTLKIAAARHLPDHASFLRFFGNAASRDNLAAYQHYIRPHIDEPTRRYWEGRDLIGRRRIGGFVHGVHKRGLLGRFIGAAHLVARLHGVDPRLLLAAQTLDEQRAIFERDVAPVFDRGLVKWLTDQPASLFGLGIPPAQFDALAGDGRMADVLRQRLAKLACDFDLSDNYFAWQAFGRRYGEGPAAPLPPYLQARHYTAVASRVDRIGLVHANLAEHLATLPAASCDRYVLLDAQDWMTDAQLDALWGEITRTARPGARILFRTAGEDDIIPGRIAPATLSRWRYQAEASRTFTGQDRSAIYGGVHLYILAGA